MNKKIQILMTAGLLGLTASCTDLDVDIDSQYTEYPSSSEVAVEAKMADVYYAFRSALGSSYNQIQTLSSDEATGISFDGDYYDGGTYSHTSLHNYLPTDGGLSYWSDLSSGITRCNTVIKDFGGDEADPSIIAPARAMRAFYHLY